MASGFTGSSGTTYLRGTIEDIFAQNAKMNAGEDSPEDLERQAEEWIAANRDEVDAWLAKARDASAM